MGRAVKSSPWLVLAVLAAAGGTFAADLHLGLGASAAPMYQVAVLLGLWSPRRGFALLAALFVTLLILAEPLVAPSPANAFTRSMTLMVAWSTAFLVFIYKRAQLVAEARRREAQAYLDIAVVAIVALDRAGRVVLVNRAGGEVLGRPDREIVGRPWFDDFVAPEHRDEARSTHKRLLTGELPSGTFHESAILTADGDRRLITWRSAILDTEGALGVLSSGEDITDRRRAEEALRAQQALARVGQMAAVVAHEVRNPLAGIKSAIQVLGGRLPQTGDERQVVRAVLDRVEDLTEMTDDLLLFARPRVPRQAPVGVLRILREASGLLAAVPEHARVKVAVQGDDVTVMGDERILRNVFFNLFLNSAQAVVAPAVVRVSVEASGSRCHVEVADGGPGVRPEWRDRIFEPFFTTRHRGTGLGLAIVKRDVEAHRGAVTALFPPAGGTVMRVDLPRPGPLRP